MGDADYLAVWLRILLPVALEFDPDLVLISAGFDSALGDPKVVFPLYTVERSSKIHTSKVRSRDGND